MTRNWSFGWTGLVVLGWLIAASAGGEDCSVSGDWVCFTFADMLLVLLLPALGVWLFGLLVLHLVLRWRRRRSVRSGGSSSGTIDI